MTVEFRSEAHNTALIAGSGFLSITKPAGVVAGDMLTARVMVVDHNPATIVPPAGWLQVGADAHVIGNRIRIYNKIAGASEGASYAFQNASFDSSTNWMSGVVVAYRSTILAPLAVDQFAQTEHSAISLSDPVAPSITPTWPRSTLVTFAIASGLGLSYTPPGVQAERYDASETGVLTTSYVGDEPLDSDAATGTRTPNASTDAQDWWAASLNIYESNVPPNAPVPITPVGGVTINIDATNRFRHQFSDDDPGDSQSAFEYQYRIVGAGSWTSIGWQPIPNQFFDFEPGTFTEDDYEWQQRTKDALGETGEWSSSSFFTGAVVATDLTIVTPTNGSIISTTPSLVEVSTPSLESLQIRVVGDAGGVPDTGTVVFDSFEIVDASARSLLVPFPTNNVDRHVQARKKESGLWSAWVTVAVSVAYTPPAKPVLTVSVFVDDEGRPAAYLMEVTNP